MSAEQPRSEEIARMISESLEVEPAEESKKIAQMIDESLKGEPAEGNKPIVVEDKRLENELAAAQAAQLALVLTEKIDRQRIVDEAIKASRKKIADLEGEETESPPASKTA